MTEGIEFNEEKFSNHNILGKQKTGLISWLIKKGVVKNERTAKILLICIIIICLLLSFLILNGSFGNNIEINEEFYYGEV